MQTSQLIDALVRQTTVLIARLSTTSGLRAPLAHVANQVFLDLVSELERQGVGRKVIADMFGLALRSYQQKVQRLQASDRGTTLWEAILGFIQQHETATRKQVLERFCDDDSATVRGVLNDLVGSTRVYRTGSGDATAYRAAQADRVQSGLDDAGRDAVLEHFQAMVGALCAKLVAAPQALSTAVGSSTFSFDVWPGHPHYEQVRGLLEQTRQSVATLWEAVQAHNAQHAPPDNHEQLSFYVGQNARPSPEALSDTPSPAEPKPDQRTG